MAFPTQRLRRLRANPLIRAMVRETTLDVRDLVYPMFVVPGRGVARGVASMPGIFQLSVDRAVAEACEVRELGIPAIILFGIPRHKDPVGSEAYDPSGVIPQAVRAIRESVPAAATRWTRPTVTRHCARSRSTSKKGRTSSWSSRRSRTST